MNFFRAKDYIGKSIIVVILLLAATAAMAMDRSTMMLMFWGDSYVSTLEMTDTLEMLDTLEMN